jgi:hypothetical protein
MSMTLSNKIWRLIALAVRVDMAAGITLAAALFLWVTWH